MAGLTVPDVAQRLGYPAWAVRRLYERKLMPDPPRAGLTRLITERDVPRILKLLQEHGYKPIAAVDGKG